MTHWWMPALGLLLLVGSVFFFRRAVARLKLAHEQETIMSMAVQQSPMAVAITEADGTIVYANPAFCRTSGYTLVELIGQNPRVLKSGTLEDSVYEDLWSTILGGEIWEGELCNKTRGGDLYWEHANIGGIRDGDGRITHFVKVAEDITEKKRLIALRERSERQFQSVFQQASMGLAIVDLEGRWKVVNASLCRILGYEESELLGRTFLEFTPEEDHGREDHWNEILLENHETPQVIEKRYIHKDGHLVAAEVSASLIHQGDGEPDFFTCVINDITRRREAEEVAARDREELAHVLRIHTLQQMTSELAHEIDQPLCAILSAAQAARRLRDTGHGDTPELDRALQMVVDQSERAGEVVRRIQDFSRKNEPQRQTVDLFGILAEARALLDPEVRHLGTGIFLETGLEGDCPVLAERIQLQQVFINLCRNAAEAMHDADVDNPLVRVSVAQDEQWIHVRVADNGPAIAHDVRDLVFTPFFTTRSDGLGLGLALCRSIIDAHGGELLLEDGGTQGNTFHFTLPRVSGQERT